MAHPQQKEIEKTWRSMARDLGKLAPHLPFARAYVGDRAFIRLAVEYSAGEVIVACGVVNSADLIGLTLPEIDPRDSAILRAVRDAHAATLVPTGSR